MTKSKMLRNVFAAALLLFAAGPLRPAFGWTYLETNTQVAVSTTITTPTTLIAASNWSAEVGILPIWSGAGTKPNSEYLLLSSSLTGFSNVASTGTARVAAGSLESDRLWLTNYSGPLYAVAIGTTTAINVSVIRKK